MNSLLPFRIEPLELRIAPSAFLVTNANDAGPGSLRQAIIDANTTPGADSIAIDFADGHAAPVVIKLMTHLPAITDQVSMDGLSARRGFMTLDGTVAEGGDATNLGSGLMLLGPASSHSTIRGFAIYGFDVAGIHLVGTSNNVVLENNLGLTVHEELVAKRMANGVLVEGGSDNAIGTVANIGNVIGGSDVGVRVIGGAQDTLITGNQIGVGRLNPNVAKPNGIGIVVGAATGTSIGYSVGEAPNNLASGNTISGNSQFGIKLAAGAEQTRVYRNVIGLDPTGSRSLGHQQWGIFMDDCGSASIGDYNDAFNVISGNLAGGIWADFESRLWIYNNRIGTTGDGLSIPAGPVGDAHFGNGGPGLFHNAGKTGSLSFVSNVVSGNVGAGVEVNGGNRPFAVEVNSNKIGADITGTKALGNRGAGVFFDGASGRIMENLVVANEGDGILIRGNNTDVGVYSNRIGVVPKGGSLMEFGNGGDGVHVIGGGAINIGAPYEALGNAIAGNRGDGIHIESDPVSETIGKAEIRVDANRIGTTVAGGIGNQGAGIYVEAVSYAGVRLGTQNLLETSRAESGNQIGGNLGGGILVERSSGVTIQSNRLMGANGGVGEIQVVDSANCHITNNMITGATKAGIALVGAAETSVLENSIADAIHGVALGGNSYATWIWGNTIAGATVAAILVEDGSQSYIDGNHLAGASGIQIRQGVGNYIRDNVFELPEGQLPIDLGGDGVTPNDGGDADSGPNGLLNSPVLKAAFMLDGQLVIRGQYHGAPNIDVQLHWYEDGAVLQSTDAATDADGIANFHFSPGREFESEARFSVYATVDDNASEFSNVQEIAAPPQVVIEGINPGKIARLHLRDSVTQEQLVEKPVFGKSYRGGLHLTMADVDADGIADIIVAKRRGSPVVKVFSGMNGEEISRFSVGLSGSAPIQSIAAGDLDGDYPVEIVVARVKEKRAQITVHDAFAGTFEGAYTPFGPYKPAHLSVDLIDVDWDGDSEIVVNATLFGTPTQLTIEPLGRSIECLARAMIR